MIFGTNNYRDIQGMEQILNINPNFVWNDVKFIEKLEYYTDFDEYADKLSNMKILFLIEYPDKTMNEIWVQFYMISGLKINNIGGKYNQIMGFEIIDQSASGWEQEQRYVVRDYENGVIEFYCKAIVIM